MPTRKQYKLYIKGIIREREGDIVGEMDIPVAYYAHNKEEAIEEASKVARAMARGISAEDEGYEMLYTILCDKSACYED